MKFCLRQRGKNRHDVDSGMQDIRGEVQMRAYTVDAMRG